MSKSQDSPRIETKRFRSQKYFQNLQVAIVVELLTNSWKGEASLDQEKNWDEFVGKVARQMGESLGSSEERQEFELLILAARSELIRLRLFECLYPHVVNTK